jgi:hypothetical protein
LRLRSEPRSVRQSADCSSWRWIFVINVLLGLTRLFRDRVFVRANAAMFFADLAFGLQLLGLVLWMQDGWGWSPRQTWLAIVTAVVFVFTDPA